jgi:hypothetical protein
MSCDVILGIIHMYIAYLKIHRHVCSDPVTSQSMLLLHTDLLQSIKLPTFPTPTTHSTRTKQPTEALTFWLVRTEWLCPPKPRRRVSLDFGFIEKARRNVLIPLWPSPTTTEGAHGNTCTTSVAKQTGVLDFAKGYSKANEEVLLLLNWVGLMSERFRDWSTAVESAKV